MVDDCEFESVVKFFSNKVDDEAKNIKENEKSKNQVTSSFAHLLKLPIAKTTCK